MESVYEQFFLLKLEFYRSIQFTNWFEKLVYKKIDKAIRKRKRRLRKSPKTKIGRPFYYYLFIILNFTTIY